MDYQNKNYIKDLMKHSGLKFNKRFGQNFLVDKNIIDKIVDTIDIKPCDEVLEIGPGIGAITGEILSRGANLSVVEIDRGFVEILKTNFDNLNVIEGDILKVDLSFLGDNVKIVGNLPYYITTPIIMHFLESDMNFESLTFMMQKEVGERIAAEVGTKEYGVLSVISQMLSEVSLEFTVSPNSFIPKPNVDSIVVTFRKKEVDFDKESVIKVVKAAFSSRRKTIKNSLSNHFDKSLVSEALDKAGIEPTIRAERLVLDDFINISKFLIKK